MDHLSDSEKEGAVFQVFPRDPAMLVSAVNMRLRNNYPDGVDQLCLDLDIDRDVLVGILAKNGFDYMPAINQFR